jgi:uncharacterized protein
VDKRLVIAAVSARPYVQAAAAAGYEVISLDAFADSDTRRAAKTSHVVQYDRGHFDELDLLRTLNKTGARNSIGMAYGGGFEAVPELLETVQKYVPLIGNTPRVVRNLKRPRQFFMLLDILQIPHPEISFTPLIKSMKQSAAGWLYKQGGGSGGTHIHRALPLPNIAPEAGWYFQREMPGVPVSLLFVADGKQARPIGFNRQWISPTPATPYRYGGAVGNAELPESVRQQLIHASQQLTNAVGLRGLNSIDGIMDGEQLWMLEINPRLSATFDLYQPADINLFELHVWACGYGVNTDGDWPRTSPLLPQAAKAQHIVYAPYGLHFPGDIEWPEWAADIPLPDSRIEVQQPVCTVIAEAGSADDAEELARSRAQSLEAILEKYKSKND